MAHAFRHLPILVGLMTVTVSAGCGAGPTERARGDAAVPPVAEARPHEVVAPHGHVRVDPYYWMRDRDDPDVLAYLRAENAHADAVMAHTAELRERIFEEIRGRILETDMSVPYRQGRCWYYTRTEEGKEHPIHARRLASPDSPEEILLDANERAEGKPFYRGSWQVSSGEDILAFAEDTVGRNIVTIRFKDLSTGELLDDVIEGAAWNMAWPPRIGRGTRSRGARARRRSTARFRARAPHPWRAGHLDRPDHSSPLERFRRQETPGSPQ